MSLNLRANDGGDGGDGQMHSRFQLSVGCVALCLWAVEHAG